MKASLEVRPPRRLRIVASPTVPIFIVSAEHEECTGREREGTGHEHGFVNHERQPQKQVQGHSQRERHGHESPRQQAQAVRFGARRVSRGGRDGD
ncbi:MAG TPA: hypothetical protein VEL10_09640 [Gaiellaceae bacterium]|nr:hypothetical protein [Gaiellaceae bacterium]